MYLYLRLLCLHFHHRKGRLLGPHPSSLHFASFWGNFRTSDPFWVFIRLYSIGYLYLEDRDFAFLGVSLSPP